MVTLFNQAARLNNEGVAALLEGCDQRAFDAFSQSVKLLKVQLSERLAPGAAAKSDFESQGSSSAATNAECCCYRTVALPVSPQAVSYIYNQVFMLPDGCHQCQRSTLNDDDVRAYTAAVIFNLSLIHHRNGSLVKAEKLYTLVSTLLSDAYYPTTLCPCMSRMVTMAKLASINNVSQIRYDCGDYEATQESLSHLSSVLRDSDGEAELSAFHDPDMQGLVLNILLFKAPSTAPAA